MKFTKKCTNTKQNQKSITNLLTKLSKRRTKRRSSADRLFTSSSVSAVTSLILMLGLCAVVNIFSNSVSASAIGPSLTVSVDSLDIDFTPAFSTPQFGESDTANISVSTDSSKGYTLSFASSTGSTDLKSGTNTISSISSELSPADFSAGTNYLNQWGYKPSSIYNSSTEQNTPNTNFLPLPDNTGAIIAKTNAANVTADTYSLSIGAKVNNTTPIGEYVSDTFVIAAVVNVLACDSSKLCIEYEGNGLALDGASFNRVNYNSTATSQEVTKYSHTANISDDGTKSGSYASNLATKDVVTIPGASSIHAKITYGTENNWDMLYVFQGVYSGDISRNMDQASTGWLYKYMGGNNTTTTVEIDIPGDTATFGFYSDGGGNYYGYYAIITGTSIEYDRSVSSGEYLTPTGTNALFYGWSTTQTTPGSGLPSQVEYTNESEILDKIPGEEGETKTLYAVWQQGWPIAFDMDSDVSKIDIVGEDGQIKGTITSSGQTILLGQGSSYGIRPTFSTGYITNTVTKTTGEGTLTGKKFTVGAGSATINVTSKAGDLYDIVADQSKGKNTAASSGFSWTSITKPTSTNPSEDTSSSGVFEWDGVSGGGGIDSNGGDQKIYFYRGILDTTLTSYGSDGLADAYPNYVKLSNNTCWRIVRTTSTGGVKMIYNGTWGDTTANSCANKTGKAQTRYNNADRTVSFNDSSSTVAGKTYSGLQYKNIHAVGYTFTSSVAPSTTSTKTPAELFGASPDGSATNDQPSIMKQYIEDWYSSTMTDYTNKLEGDAGFCQDRRLNTSSTWTTPLAEDSNTIVPYGTSGLTQYYFGAYPRNTLASTFNPLLTCPRGKVDLYSYSNNAGNGNGQLTYPTALLTADEASLAGSGNNNSFSAYNANSFLHSGSYFWLLSPYYRYSNGGAYGFILGTLGGLDHDYVFRALGVRPAISLTSGTIPVSGTGTATDPWIVNP